MKSSVILNEADLQEAVSYFRKQKKIVFDVEAMGDNRGVPHLSQLSWISLATSGSAVTVPFAHPIGDKVIDYKPEPRYYKSGTRKGQAYKTPLMVPVYDEPPKQISTGNVFEILKPLFWEPGLIKEGHGFLYDLTATKKYYGEIIPPPYGDTIIKQWLLNENMIGRLGLKDLVIKYYKDDYDTDNSGKKIETVPFSKAAKYTYLDAKYTWLLSEKFDPMLDAENLRNIYDIEMGVLGALVRMQLHGAKVDIEALKELQIRLKEETLKAEQEVYLAAGHTFNLNSPKQKQVVLYQEQKLKPWKLTKGGKKKQSTSITDYSTDDDVLASYPDNKVAVALREHGDLSKLLNTYVEGWLGNDEKDSIIYSDHIHADFVQYGTVTGRFSCRKPNLQNIPRPYTDLGKLVRGAFISETGGQLVVADYSQIELVVLAHYIGKGKLFEAFQQGIDPHTMTAAMVLSKRPEDVTKEERQDLGKTLGFAVVYGAGLGKVASMAKITTKRAKEVLATHAEMFPEIHAFKNEVIRTTRSRKPQPYLTTLLGRKRRIMGINSMDEGFRMGAERQAFNSLIQGGAADIIKLAMVRLDRTLPDGVALILTIHDELVVAAPNNKVDETVAVMREAMIGEGIQKYLKVPLSIDIKPCERWSEAK